LIRSEPMNIDIKIPPRHITGSTPGVRYHEPLQQKLGEQNTGEREEKTQYLSFGQ